MRIVLDTNVLISGVFFGGYPRRILEAWRDGLVALVLTPEILHEYVRVGERLAARHGELELGSVLQLIGVVGDLVEADPMTEMVTEDPDDEKFLACARTAGVKVIVSGDGHLLAASGWSGIDVMSPADFCRRFLTDRGE